MRAVLNSSTGVSHKARQRGGSHQTRQ
jgi:hypothetical protein